MDPAKNVGLDESSPDVVGSSQPNEYANIVEVMQEKKWIQRSRYINQLFVPFNDF